MRPTILLLAAGILNLPATYLSAQVPALSVMPDLPRSMLERLKSRLSTLIAQADSPKFHTEIDVTLDSVFAADCGGLFRKPTGVFTRKRGSCFWGKHEVSALNLGNVTGGGNTGSLYTDLSTAYFGPLRLSFSTLVSASGNQDEQPGQDEESRAAFQRLIAGGGNVVVSVQAPLLHWRARSVNGLRFTTALLGRGAADVAALGSDSARAQARSFAGAADLRLQLNSNDEQVALFAYTKGEYVRGSDPVPAFLQSVTVMGNLLRQAQDTSSLRPVGERRHLYYGQMSVGARLLNAVVVTYTYYACAQCRRAGVSNQVSITAQKSGI
jgi:hypothetical protein